MANTLTPREVISIIESHKSSADQYGDSAFVLQPIPGREAYSFKIKDKSGEKPIRIKFKNLISLFNHDIETAKFPGFSICYDLGHCFMLKGERQEFGHAVELVCMAFKRLMKRLIDDGKAVNSNNNITVPVKRERFNKDRRAFEPLPNPRGTIKVPFRSDKNRAISPDEQPRIQVYDSTKPIPRTDKRYIEGGWNFEVAKIDGCPITYGNIGKFITRGSESLGWCDLSYVAVTTMGFNLGCSAGMLSVKSAGADLKTFGVFSPDEIEELMESEPESAPAQVVQPIMSGMPPLTIDMTDDLDD